MMKGMHDEQLLALDSPWLPEPPSTATVTPGDSRGYNTMHSWMGTWWCVGAHAHSPHSFQRLNATTLLWPPKPNEFDNATSMSLSCASEPTRMVVSTSGSGDSRLMLGCIRWWNTDSTVATPSTPDAPPRRWPIMLFELLIRTLRSRNTLTCMRWHRSKAAHMHRVEMRWIHMVRHAQARGRGCGKDNRLHVAHEPYTISAAVLRWKLEQSTDRHLQPAFIPVVVCREFVFAYWTFLLIGSRLNYVTLKSGT